MALNTFKFASSNEKLNDLLNYALSGMVRDDLDRFEMPMASNLDLLHEHRGLGYEDCIEFNFLPHGNGVKDMPVNFVVVSNREPGEEEAGLYTYSEFARGLYAELMKQSEGNGVLRERAERLIQKYDLQKYASA